MTKAPEQPPRRRTIPVGTVLGYNPSREEALRDLKRSVAQPRVERFDSEPDVRQILGFIRDYLDVGDYAVARKLHLALLKDALWRLGDCGYLDAELAEVLVCLREFGDSEGWTFQDGGWKDMEMIHQESTARLRKAGWPEEKIAEIAGHAPADRGPQLVESA